MSNLIKNFAKVGNLRKVVACLLLITIAAATGYTLLPHGTGTGARASVIGLPPASGDFKRADGSQLLSFPADFGPHLDYQTEWWYYTGNLTAADGRHFGYQLTFFRRAILAPDERAARSSSWAVQQVYMAHFALTDAGRSHFYAFEQFARGSAGLAGAQSTPVFQVWLYDWQVIKTGDKTYHLLASGGGVTVELVLNDDKGPILEGDRGYSQKGPDPGNASYYFSQTRLVTSGEIQINQQSFNVNGLSWMDHEFSTSALAPEQIGWDWFAFQMSDGSELMLYTIRDKDGSIDPYSSGTYIAPDGRVTWLKQDEFKIEVNAKWRSPASKANYPAHWTVSIPTLGIKLDIAPFLNDQELKLSFTYWEGAVHFTGQHADQAISGEGYIEMTGYAQSIQGQFFGIQVVKPAQVYPVFPPKPYKLPA